MSIVQGSKSWLFAGDSKRAGRMAFLLFLIFLSSFPDFGTIIAGAMSEAFLQVTVFVAFTLAAVKILEHLLGVATGDFLRRFRRLQPVLSAFLGAIPGCGGAIVVVTQYTRGNITFGSLVAALIATMGDAAFLLLARDFWAGVLVIVTGLVVGSLFGILVDMIHGYEFMTAEYRGLSGRSDCVGEERRVLPSLFAGLQPVWIGLITLGFLLGILVHVGFLPDERGFWNEDMTARAGFWGTFLCLGMWAFWGTSYDLPGACYAPSRSADSSLREVITDTNFVTVWVLIGFLVYELTIHVLGIDIGTLFRGWEVLFPIIAILIGFLPGCGPQIVVSVLYLNGTIPFSAQLGNAIANDGDALFPAIALFPRAAILATLYSAVPAVILAYGYFIFLE